MSQTEHFPDPEEYFFTSSQQDYCVQQQPEEIQLNKHFSEQEHIHGLSSVQEAVCLDK